MEKTFKKLKIYITVRYQCNKEMTCKTLSLKDLNIKVKISFSSF